MSKTNKETGVLEVKKSKKTKEVQEVEMVEFYNGKVFRDKPSPWMLSGYTDANGVAIQFKEIQLYKAELVDGKPVLDEFVDQHKNKLIRTWDKKIDFTSARKLVLHPIVHKDVIKIIRDYYGCASTKKSPGLKPVKLGIIVEYQPKEKEKEMYESSILEIQAMKIMGQMIEEKEKNTDLWRYFTTTVGFSRGSEESKLIGLSELSKKNPAKFMDYFNPANEKGQLILKQEHINPAIVQIGIAKGVIEMKNGVWFFFDKTLGSDSRRIHEDHKLVSAIKAELDQRRDD